MLFISFSSRPEAAALVSSDRPGCPNWAFQISCYPILSREPKKAVKANLQVSQRFRHSYRHSDEVFNLSLSLPKVNFGIINYFNERKTSKIFRLEKNFRLGLLGLICCFELCFPATLAQILLKWTANSIRGCQKAVDIFRHTIGVVLLTGNLKLWRGRFGERLNSIHGSRNREYLRISWESVSFVKMSFLRFLKNEVCSRNQRCLVFRPRNFWNRNLFWLARSLVSAEHSSSWYLVRITKINLFHILWTKWTCSIGGSYK